MIGTLSDVIKSMQDGVYNFCVDGKCSGCGRCCSALLPISNQELYTIKKYVKKHNIKPHVHNAFLNNVMDLVCPFLDESKTCDKCSIYEVRPKICKVFKCNQPPSKVKENKEMFWKTRKPFFMWEIFK